MLHLLIFEGDSCHFLVHSLGIDFDYRHLEFIFFLNRLSFSLYLDDLVDDLIDCFMVICFQEVDEIFLIFVRDAYGEIVLVLVFVDSYLIFLLLLSC